MLRLLIAVVVLGGLFYLVKRLRDGSLGLRDGSPWLRDASPELRRRYWRQLLIGAAALLLIGLAVSGRIHWLGALFGALLPLLQPLIAALARELPDQLRQRAARNDGSANGPGSGGAMSHAEALAILGLEEGADRDTIVRTHRLLMQRLHPDRGGNHYLASQLNRAKELLLKSAKR